MNEEIERGEEGNPFLKKDLKGGGAYKWCQCHGCGVKEVCTPSRGFYRIAETGED